MFNVRPALVAVTLIASLAVAHAQTAPQNQDAHHPDTVAPASPAVPPSGAPQGPMGMSGMGMDRMMGGNMEQMMRRMMAMDDMPGMMAGMGPGGRMMAGVQHIEGQIAFYKAELHITDAQLPQWNAFADAMRSSAKRLQDAGKGAMTMMQGSAPPSVPDQLAARRQILSARLDSLQGIEPAMRSLYGVLSAEQKKTADELMADHLRRM